MTNTKVKYHIRTKGTTSCQLQTDHHLQTTSIDVQSVEILPTMKDSHAQLRNTNARHVISLDILPVNVSKGKHIKYRLMTYMTAQTVTHQMLAPAKVKIKRQPDGTQKIPRPIYLIKNIAYWLKQQYTRNQYLRARIDTGAEVNLMPVNVYRLI